MSRGAALLSARLVAVWLCAIGAAGAAVQATHLAAIDQIFEGRNLARIFASGIPFVAGAALWLGATRFADTVHREAGAPPEETDEPEREGATSLAVTGLALAGIYLIATAVNPIVTSALQLIDGPLLSFPVAAEGFWRSHWWRLAGEIIRVVIGASLIASRHGISRRIVRVR